MALTITSNLTEITDGDTATNWEVENLASGHGIDTDQYIEGNGCYSGTSKTSGVSRIYYNSGSGNTQNLTSEVLRIWARFTELAKYEDVDDMGIAVYVEDSSANWGEWAVGGAGSAVDESWQYFVIDTSLAFNNTSATSPNMAVIQKVGISVNMSAKPARAANLFVDAIRYGDGLTITGTCATTGDGFAEIAKADDATANKYGVFRPIKGVGYALTGKLVFGDSSGTNSVNFTDSKSTKIVVQENHLTYLNGTNPFYRWCYGSSIDNRVGFELVGNSTGNTDFQLGTVIGTGDDRQGILGGMIFSQRDNFFFDAETDTANIDSCYLYGVKFQGAGTMKFAGASTQKVIGCEFNDCEEIQPNTIEFLNNKVISPTPRGVELVSSTAVENIDFVAGGTGNKPIDHFWRFIPQYEDDYATGFNRGVASTGGSFQLLTSTPNVNEYCSFGFRKPYGKLTLNITTARIGGTLVWEYYNGSSWTSLNSYDLVDGTNTFNNVGINSVTWNIPSDWEKIRIKREELTYQVRARLSSGTTSQTPYCRGGAISDTIEYHVHAPSTGTVNANNLNFYGHPSSPGFPQYHIENSNNATTENSYTTANQDTLQVLGNGTYNGVGQSFTGAGGVLANVRVQLSKTGTPNGNAVAKIYAHSGTLGTSSVPTGNALATSENFDVSDLTTSLKLIDFEFKDEYTLTNTTNYVFTVEYDGGNTGNYVNVGTDTSSPTHAGNFSTKSSGTWTANSSEDAIFYIYTGGIVTVAATGGNPGTYNNTGVPPGATIIGNTVTVSVRAIDAVNSANIQDARVYLWAAS
ncbi:MAG: hypothetical protein ACXADH_03900, partial [Candidatus Kariarchaeaceae archaeon]